MDVTIRSEAMIALDQFLFGVLPYLAFGVFFLLTIRRYRQQAFTYSSLSSQFLENKQHFWGMVPFHYGLLLVILGHVIGFLMPATVLAWNGNPLRLYLLEITGFALGLFAFFGMIAVIMRRLKSSRLRRVTSWADTVLYVLLLTQIATGLQIAIVNNWGSSWFAAAMSPYLWSLLKLSPNVALVGVMPWTVKAHILCAFALVGFFPFTRLVHILVIPNPYLWRKNQVVRWNWSRRRKAEQRLRSGARAR